MQGEAMSNAKVLATVTQESSLDTVTSLAWLADAPLFIDKDQVASFYDAVVRPEGQQGKTVISLERLQGQTTKLQGSVEGEFSVSKILTTFLPFLDIKAKVSGGGAYEQSGSQKRGETVEFSPIDTPQRQLVHLALHYLANLPNRVRIVADPTKPGWHDEKYVQGLPRALVFLDFPDRSKFTPMAAEVKDGHVVTIFDQLRSREGEAPPAYPERHSFANEQEYGAAWDKYWEWFETNFSSKIAMETVEKVIASGGRIQWIDYRVPLPGQRPLHLHICGRGQYDTGTFAYNLVKRGFNHGLRVVGTLKSEPDLNVLAIFEK
jgi:hypothetical protein